MRLSELLKALPTNLAPQRGGSGDPRIRGIRYDSRSVSPGDLFVALRGENADGHAFLEQAVALGAVALLVETLPEGWKLRIPTARVPDTRRALAPLAARYFGTPARELRLIGVTGTNGKTSTTYLIESMLRAAGRRPGIIGTVEIRYGQEHTRSTNTTPESLDLQRTLRAMRTTGVDAVAMEVSSHGLALGRVDGCRFGVAAMTNVTQDHLDFHETMDAYRSAKTRLFSELLAPGGAAVVNLDDPSAAAFLAAAGDARCLRVSRAGNPQAEVRVEEARVSLDGSEVSLALPSGRLETTLPLLGDFNLENLTVAVGVAVALDLSPTAIAKGAAHCPQVPGRVERVQLPDAAGDLPAVLVDYAHTPDAVDKLLRTLKPLTRGRLITVFGCGGDRDRSKRPLMAEAVARFSDRAVVTSDNPRNEDPDTILQDVEAGLGALRRVAPAALGAAPRSYARLRDRREAIALAIGLARPGDLVVLAGKGHEDYQIVGCQKLPFDDREEAARALAVTTPGNTAEDLA